MSCLPCGAAIRDATDLLGMVAAAGVESPQAASLLSGMDSERIWRALLYMTGIAAGIADSYADATGLTAAEVVQIIRSEMTGVNHEH